jgi:hypothetical protein
MLHGCLLIADLTELQLPSNININFPEGKEKPMHFEISIKPDEGYYRCGGMRLQQFQSSVVFTKRQPLGSAVVDLFSCVGQLSLVEHGKCRQLCRKNRNRWQKSWHFRTPSRTA